MQISETTCVVCKVARIHDDYGPVTPCACFVEHHEEVCELRRTVEGHPGVYSLDTCEDHGAPLCLRCVPCLCDAEATFQTGNFTYEYEPGVGLVRTTMGDFSYEIDDGSVTMPTI